MKRYILVFLLYALIGLIVPKNAYAHQSGCHRWHSCPSDSGSYVCGDLGYTNYCGTESYYEEVDYTDDGQTKGNEHAGNDKSAIEAEATRLATLKGESDGETNQKDSTPVDVAYCSKTFNFDGYAPEEYQSAYTEAYKDSCEDTYEVAYAAAYETSYDEGQATYENKTIELNMEDTSSDDSGSMTGTIVGVVIIGALLLFFIKKA